MSVSVKLDGVIHTWEPMESNALDASALRRATGMSVNALMRAAVDDPDIDVIAGIVFMAQRQAGNRAATFDQVATDIGYGTDFELVDSEGEGGDPEA